MVPYVTILAIAIIGGFVHGIAGFFIWGVCGLVGVLAVGWALNFFSGGLLPRKVRDESATDFIAQYSDLVKRAYPTSTPYEAKQKVAELLDSMMKRATAKNPSLHLDVAGSPDVFFPSALQVAEEQPTAELKELAQELISFVRSHRLWYQNM